ncbi:MAG: hypothetical protein JXR23_07060 [Pontiellaceae bacterium]|nr:hypothetical protein [Pontiellaceae bacterium]
MNTMCAVLTGDVVDSSSLSPELHSRVIGLLKSMNKAFPEVVFGEVDVFRGDSWQLVLSKASAALRVALYLRACLKRERAFSVDSRISIALGEENLRQVNLVRVSESTGELFTASGRGLSRLSGDVCMSISVLQNEPLSAALDGMIVLVDSLVRSWSVEQARAVAGMLMGQTQREIAETFGVGQSSIHKSLRAAHWSEIERVLDQFGRIKFITT